MGIDCKNVADANEMGTDAGVILGNCLPMQER